MPVHVALLVFQMSVIIPQLWCDVLGKVIDYCWPDGPSGMNTDFTFTAEHQRPKAAMRSPIPLEPMHLFWYGHLF